MQGKLALKKPLKPPNPIINKITFSKINQSFLWFSLNEVIKMGEIIGLILTIILGLFAYFLCYLNYLKRAMYERNNEYNDTRV